MGSKHSRFLIESKKQAIVFVILMTILGGFLGSFLPVEWSVAKKIIAGSVMGFFWSGIAMTSRIIGAYESDEE